MSGDHNMNQSDSGWRKRQIALDKKAENARELGLNYEPNKTVIEMAREAGGMDGWGKHKPSDPELSLETMVFDPDDLERFAELVRADEREALAQPEREPEQKRPQNCGTGYCSCIECVMKPSPRAWLIEFENGDEELHFDEQSVGEIHVPLYTTPPQRTWVGLTDEEIQVIAKKARSKDHAVTLTNQFLKEKNL